MISISIQQTHGTKLSIHFIGRALLNEKNEKIESEKVILVKADGDELERIVNTVNNIPHIELFEGGSRSQTWRGDLAKFIVDNVDFSQPN